MRCPLFFLALLTASTALAQTSTPDSLVTPTGTLHGTLLMPAGVDGPVPVALILAGSGPTDRDGNSPLGVKAASYRLLAEALAGRGVATLRPDKRGVAASAGALQREADLTFDTYVDDAGGWLRRLQADARFSTVAVVGHSEGALVGTLAAQAAGADGAALVAGPSQPIGQTLRRQLRPQLPAALMAQADSALSRLERGETTEAPLGLESLFRPSVQPYLMAWMRHDPAEALAALTVPVLVVGGTEDLQVEASDAVRLAAARPGAELVLVDGMTHALKIVAEGDVQANRATYADPSLPIAPDLVEAVARFVLGLTPAER